MIQISLPRYICKICLGIQFFLTGIQFVYDYETVPVVMYGDTLCNTETGDWVQDSRIENYRREWQRGRSIFMMSHTMEDLSG